MWEKIPYKYVALYLNKIYNVDNARVISSFAGNVTKYTYYEFEINKGEKWESGTIGLTYDMLSEFISDKRAKQIQELFS